MSDVMRKRAELADFLKTRRSRLHPEQFGLPDIGRRRTPGLRRDEVAQLAGVGVSWYTWLEQGRAITVSDQVLESLARILQLNAGERRHLFLLARGMVPVSDENHALSLLLPGQQAVLDALGISPAYLLDQRFNVIAWNESACRVIEDFSLLSERDRNAIWSIFMHPAKRKLFVDWELALQNAVMSFRARYDQHAGEAWAEQLVADLKQASPEFRNLWSQHDIQWSCDPHEKDLHHPQVGRLLFYSAMLDVPEAPTVQMTIFTPRSQETMDKLEALLRSDLPGVSIPTLLPTEAVKQSV
jgi:transcriptional regulator with XRE-family HTH domain